MKRIESNGRRASGGAASGRLVFRLCVLTALMLLGCSRPSPGAEGEKPAAARTVTDSYGRRVELPSEVRRVISLSPGATEILFVLGADDLLVGRTDYCDYPAEAKRIGSVGTITNPNLEKIAGLRADLVIASDHFQKETLKLIEALGLPVYVGVVRKEYDDVYRFIRDIGVIVGKTAEAERTIADMKRRISAVETSAGAAATKPKVYYMVSFGDEGDFTAPRGSFISFFIRSAGGRNLGDEIEGWRYSTEGLFRNEPDLIVAGTGRDVKMRLPLTAPYNRLKAVKEGRVYEVDANLLERIGPRNAEGLERLVKIIHPELKP